MRRETLRKCGASIIFNPEADEMYDNALTFVDMNKITKVLCG